MWTRLLGKHSWKHLSLIGDETVINLQRAKVYVFSDSVLCLGRVHQHPRSNKAWKERIGWIITDKSYRDYDGIKIREEKGQSGGIIQKGEPHERNPCAPGFEEQPPEETSRQEDCTSKSSVEFGEKICKFKAEDNNVLFSCEEPERQTIVCLLWIREWHAGSTVFFTHFPKDRKCEVCIRTKMTRAPCRRRTGEAVPRAEKFGDLTTADHKVLNEEGETRNNHRYAVVVQDLATQWIQSYQCKKKNFSGDGKEFKKVSRAVRKAKSHVFSQFFWSLEIL